MDHSHSHVMETVEGEKSCPMSMVFHNGHCETILFRAWTATTVTEFVLSAIAIFLMGIAYEGLKSLREYLITRDLKKLADANDAAAKSKHNHNHSMEAKVMLKDPSYKDRLTSCSHLIQTVLNFVQVTLGYLLMLIAMTFNVWLFLAVVLGFGAGYLIFGCIRTNKIDHDCCG